MSLESAPPPAAASPPTRFFLSRWFDQLRQNPMTLKELRARMRGRRAFVILTLYLAALATIVTLIYTVSTLGNNGNTTQLATIGKSVFVIILMMQGTIAIFLTPAFTASSITGEKERQTYDLLRTTLLSPHALVLGKLASSLSYVILLILAAIPLQSIAFLLGGVSFIELFISQLLLIITAITFGLLGLYISSIMRSTIASTVSTYGIIFFLVFGLPVLTIFGVSMFSITMVASSSPPPVLQQILLLGGIFLCALNLPATLIVSDLLLLEFDALFFTIERSGTTPMLILSPWWLYLLLFSFFAFLFFRATISQVKRIPHK